MSEFSQFSQQRAFHCIHCNGRIVIPADLPATTGPCPHCQGTITSPDPLVHSSVIDENLKPISQSRPAAEAGPEHAGAQSTPSSPIEPSKKTDSSTKRSNPVALLIVFVLVLIALGGGAYFVLDILKSKNESNPVSAPKFPTKPSSNPTLVKYLAAKSLDEKSGYVTDAERLRPTMEAFYKDGLRDENSLNAKAFTSVPLPEMDSEKGFVLFAYDQKTPEQTRILAFLKETEAGVKLDWEVFAQTKYRTYQQFINTPVIGKSEVFRVIISLSTVDGSGQPKNPASYILSDPAHSGDRIELTPDQKSQAGQALARLNLESSQQPGNISRTATVELAWSGDANKPQLEIKRFICWEFLGLGGKEIAGIQPSN